MHSIQSFWRSVGISRSVVVTVRIGYLSMQTNAKLYETLSCDLQIDVQCLVCLNNQSMGTVSTNVGEAQAFLESHWTEFIPPVWIYAVLYVNAWAVSTTLTCSPSVVFSSLSPFAHLGSETIQCPIVLRIRFITVTYQILYTNFKSRYCTASF